MEIVVGIVQNVLIVLVDVLFLAMLIRALLSWMPLDEDSKIALFFYSITEPLIIPVRVLCDRFHWFEGSPLDVPYLITSMLLAVLSTLLSIL